MSNVTKISEIQNIEEGEAIEAVKGVVGYVSEQKTFPRKGKGKKGNGTVQNIELIDPKDDECKVRVALWDHEEIDHKQWKGKVAWIVCGDDGKLVVKDNEYNGEITKQLSATNCEISKGSTMDNSSTGKGKQEASDNDGGEPADEPDDEPPKQKQSAAKREEDPDAKARDEERATKEARILSAQFHNAYAIAFEGAYFTACLEFEKNGIDIEAQQVKDMATVAVLQMKDRGIIFRLPVKPIYTATKPTTKNQPEE